MHQEYMQPQEAWLTLDNDSRKERKPDKLIGNMNSLIKRSRQKKAALNVSGFIIVYWFNES